MTASGFPAGKTWRATKAAKGPSVTKSLPKAAITNTGCSGDSAWLALTISCNRANFPSPNGTGYTTSRVSRPSVARTLMP